jgi:carbamoyltransferase
MYILGINAYHGGASACIIKDGQLVAAVEEERFTRVKYWAGFPVQSIHYCLREAGISVHDLDHVGISRDPRANIFRKAKFALRQLPNAHFLLDRAKNLRRVGGLARVFCDLMGVSQSDLHIQFHNVEHHRAHLASAFFVSPFEKAAVLSVDGMGDFSSTMWGVGDGHEINLQGAIHFPHSIGIVYTAVSQWLGFRKYGDEGKLMGLAPYGKPNHVDRMRQIVRVQSDGTFEIDQGFLQYQAEGGTMTWSGGAPNLGRLYSKRFVSLFGEPRDPGEKITSYHQDVAASLQAITEEAEFALVRKLRLETELDAICIAGGVALNSVFNGKVLPETDFTDIYVQPAASDSGTALGVCFYIYCQILGNPRKYEMRNAYTGPRFENSRVQAVLDRENLHYETFSEHDIAREVAELVADGKVVGWFQGRMEWGPRALGHRSIVADPRRSDMKDTLNARIKNRESFRPFAPSILEDATGQYFDQDYPDPFMLKVYNVLPEQRDKIPAVTHVDGSGRLQTVSRDVSPHYWEMINAFRERTGVPVVLNTSFNENEPIVCTPEEAVSCFMRTRMDSLAIGNYLVNK